MLDRERESTATRFEDAIGVPPPGPDVDRKAVVESIEGDTHKLASIPRPFGNHERETVGGIPRPSHGGRTYPSLRRLASRLTGVPLDEIEDVAPPIPYSTANFDVSAARSRGPLSLYRALRASAKDRVFALGQEKIRLVACHLPYARRLVAMRGSLNALTAYLKSQLNSESNLIFSAIGRMRFGLPCL